LLINLSSWYTAKETNRQQNQPINLSSPFSRQFERLVSLINSSSSFRPLSDPFTTFSSWNKSIFSVTSPVSTGWIAIFGICVHLPTISLCESKKRVVFIFQHWFISEFIYISNNIIENCIFFIHAVIVVTKHDPNILYSEFLLNFLSKSQISWNILSNVLKTVNFFAKTLTAFKLFLNERPLNIR